jgi:biopolymer transport protein ExbB
MKNFFALLAMIGLLTLGANNVAYAQQGDTTDLQTVESTETTTTADDGALEEGETPMHQQVKRYFIEGNPIFMSFVLIALILGLAFAIERIIYLSFATTNSKKMLANIEGALDEGGIEAAKEVCRNTRGPVASIFYQGLDRSDEGIEMVEKTIVSYGSVQMGLLERGLTWIALFIALAPMLGFMGTVIGMISAFDSIQAMGEISPGAVAGGIKVALITTVSGLIVAIILQIFYNFIVSKVDSIVNNMEDSSIAVVDLLIKYNAKNN